MVAFRVFLNFWVSKANGDRHLGIRWDTSTGQDSNMMESDWSMGFEKPKTVFIVHRRLCKTDSRQHCLYMLENKSNWRQYCYINCVLLKESDKTGR
jgi:hypothetical protein